jgi:prepilin-type N-terminal cleavage/methylation domain-containing protein
MRARAGFTLLEVLAAVLVVGMVFPILARMNIQGLRAEGNSARRLEASLIADQAVAEIEIQLASGSAPQVGQDEREREEFRIRVEVTPLEFTLAALPEELAATPRPGDEAQGNSLLATPDSGRVTPLRHVHIAVAWQDGVFEESVVRDTFVFDAASVSGTLEGLQDTQRAPRGRNQAGEDEDAGGEEP